MRNKIVAAIVWMVLMAVGVSAQTGNRLTVGDIVGGKGSMVLLPVAMENTAEIVAVEFTLDMPEGVTLITDKTTKSERLSNHTISVREVEHHRYKFILMSANNDVVKGSTGNLFSVEVRIGSNIAVNSSWPMAISDAVMSLITGENVLTEATAGEVHISDLPGLALKDVSVDKQSFTPGERIVASWQVMNTGDMPFEGGWREQVSLVTEDKTVSKVLATMHYGEALPTDGIISRQTEIILPEILGVDGRCWLEVRMVPNIDAALATTKQSDLITINKVLSIKLTPTYLEENAGGKVMVKVSRSGCWTADETFSLTATADSRLTVPSTITIPAGQSGVAVSLTVTDNDIVDDTSDVALSVEGNGYPAAVAHLTIEDNEQPDLQVTASKSVVNEGETFQLTITACRASSTPLEVTLTSENDKRFTYPRKVTIPAGQTSVTVDVTAKDDDIPSADLSNAFTVSAPRYNKAEVIVLLKDDDLPVLELTLTPNTVSEGVGVVAVAGVLRRTTNTNSKITVKLTDDADGGLYFGNRTLELAKGVEEVHFNFGPVDNALVEGDRTYTITAAVWLSSCSCSAAGESAGSVSAQLQVLDDDGPALSIASSLSTVKEGGKTTITISRNTIDTSKALNVTLSSDYDEGLTYNHTVTIPAGRQSATVEVTSATNSMQGDSHIVIFTVQAEGYASGTCYMMVTDQTLPDARISSISSSIEEAEVGQKVKLTIEVVNDGAAELPAEVTVKVYRHGDSNAMGTVYTSEAIAVGATQTVTKIITLPTTVGSHSYYAVVNQENKVQELMYNNNTSAEVTITTVSPFATTVSTDKAVYKQGEKVIVTGQLAGKNIANAQIDIYLINEGSRQVQTVTTDASGTFSYEWQLYSLQFGHFAVGACYPGEPKTEEMATFDVYGLRRTSYDFITCEAKLGEPYEGVISIENPGLLPQTITSFEVVSKPDACEVVLEAPTTIAANGTAQLKYKLTGSAVTETKDWETIVTKIATDEGSTLTIILYYFCTAHYAVLTTNTTNIKTTMTKGAARDYLLNVMNTGKGASGKIKVLLPDVGWMKLNTPAEIPSLDYGETATISLRLTPTDDMVLNLPYTGRIALNCENGNGVTVSYNIEVVSEATGILIVDVVDEYTYYTDEKNHVAGADVVVKHPVSGAIVAQGSTGDDGIYSVELQEGYYSITVTEGHHNSMSGNILIDPGTTNNQEIFLSYNAITYSWDVVESEIEDEYKIETIAKFETNVPKPVVVVNLPTERPADGSIITILVTNKGLINAQNVVMNLDCTDGYELELLNPDPVDILAPQQMYTFYARFMKNPSAHSRRKTWGNPDVDCVSIFAGALYDYICGNAENMEEALAQNGWGDCIDDINYGSRPSWRIKPAPLTVPNLPGGSSDSDGKPYSIGPGILETLRQWFCSLPCGKELTQALACEAEGAIIPDWISCPYDLLNNCVSKGRSMSGCVKSGLTCTPEGSHTDCWLPYLYCLYEHYKNKNSRGTLRTASAGNTKGEIAGKYITSSTLLEQERNAFWKIVEEHFGDKAWLDFDNEELASILDVVDYWGEDHLYTSDDFQKVKPALVSDELLNRFVERLNNTFQNTDYEGLTNYIHPDTLTFYTNAINECEEEAIASGWSGVAEMYTDAYNAVKEFTSESTSSVCASVSIKISQTTVMTRQAFRGTLTVFNGNEDIAMQDIKLNLVVTNPTGNQATSHEFQLNAESLDGFIGELDLSSGWTLDANATGTATILFIPTKYAAPDEPVEWSFGGTLSYIDPFTGLEVTRELYPVTLTVNPSPELDLTYFMQRDIYGDDPLTTDVVESMEPAEFALIINNKGYGDATNVRMLTEQPKIIENEKGLYVDFENIRSQINGGDANLSFGRSIANDFGTIPAHSQMYAQWWLTSTLLGHFTDYNVEANHVTSYGNEDLSLLDQVTIHEMIHGFTLNTMHPTLNVPLRGYLVNDIVDADDMPDVVYFTDASQQDLYIAQNGKIDRYSENEYLLNVMPSQAGWNYGSVTDPTYGRQKLTKIVRKSDGIEIPVDNIWQTDRTLRDGRDWLYENRLHFVGNMSADGETFILTFEPIPELELAVESYAGIPEKGSVLKEQLTELTVKFNKPIKAESFTTEDITLNCEGVKQDASQIVIEKQSEQEYKLILNEVTLGDGYYVLTVQTAGISDMEGFNGSTGKHTTWIQFVDGKVALKVTASPTEGGTVTPSSGRYDYDSEVTLTATPTDGYTFSSWKQGDNVLSSDNVITYHVVANTTLTAQFTINHYAVSVDYDASAGTVDGYGTGIYDHGTQLRFVAVPAKDYLFDCWTVNGEKMTGETLTLTVTEPLDIRAEFTRDIYEQTFTLTKGWNWMSSYLSEPINVTALSVYANRIVGQFDEMIRDPQFGLVGGFWQLTTGEAYKVEALTRFSTSFRGHLFDVTQNPISMNKGWNWVGYPWPEERLVSTTIPDAEEGDYIVSQSGFSEFADGYWEGSLRKLTPGEGYLYKSYSDKTLSYDFTNVPADSRTDQFTVHNPQFTVDVIDVNRYPNTMNVTARIYQDDMELTGDNYLLYAMNGDELRGIGEYVGSNYYLTVYGDLPLDINFMVVDAATGETFVANEHIEFRDDVVGSRKQPFAISIGKTTGIADVEYSTMNMDNSIYDLQGRKIRAEANSSLFTIHSSLRKGVYIVNGHKVINGKYINK